MASIHKFKTGGMILPQYFQTFSDGGTPGIGEQNSATRDLIKN